MFFLQSQLRLSSNLLCTLIQTFYYYEHPSISNTSIKNTLSLILFHDLYYFSNNIILSY